MLDAFRKLGETWFIKVFLLLLALTFVSWGVGDYLTGSSYGAAITLGKTDIPLQKIDQGYASQKQLLEKGIGRTLPNQELVAIGLPTRYLVRLLQETTLIDFAKQLNLVAPAQAVMKMITDNQLFHGDNGFDINLYKNTLRSIGYTTEGYENEQRREMLINLTSNIFAPPALPTSILKPVLIEANSRLNLTTMKLTANALDQQPVPTEEALAAFYNEHQAQYMRPATRDLAVLNLNTQNLKTTLAPTDEELQAYYEDNQARYSTAEKRHARQILVSDEATAKNLVAELTNGADFSALAKQYSEDSQSAAQGGDLGFLTAQELPEDIANVLFNLPESTVSEPIASPLGYHLLEVTDIQPADTPEFSELKDIVVEHWQASQAETLYYDTLEDVEDQLAAGEPLDAIAQTLGLTVTNYPSYSEENQYDLSDDVAQAVMLLPEGDTSDAITLNDDSTTFVQVRAITPAQAIPLADIKQQVTQDWTQQTTLGLLYEKAQQLAKNVGPKTMQEVLQEAGTEGTIQTWSRLSQQAGADKLTWLTNDARAKLMQQNGRGKVVKPIPDEQAVYVVQLTGVVEPALGEQEMAQGQMQYRNQIAEELSGEFLNYRLAQANVSYNIPLLQRVFGEEFNVAQAPMATLEVQN